MNLMVKSVKKEPSMALRVWVQALHQNSVVILLEKVSSGQTYNKNPHAGLFRLHVDFFSLLNIKRRVNPKVSN